MDYMKAPADALSAIPEIAPLARARGGDRLIRREKYSNYVVLAPFFRTRGETFLVFEKRAAGIRQGGEICLPGGAVEADLRESAEEAAVRETMEELGLPREKIHLGGSLGVFVTPWGSAVDLFYGALDIRGTADCHPDPGEVAKVFAVPLRFFWETPPEVHQLRHQIRPESRNDRGRWVPLPWRKLGLPRRYSRPWDLRSYPSYFYHWEGEIIWGMTADLVREILDLLTDNS